MIALIDNVGRFDANATLLHARFDDNIGPVTRGDTAATQVNIGGNALPNAPDFAMSLGFVIGGSIVTEVVFNYPGLGTTLFKAAQAADYPLMSAIFLLITIMVLVANLLADVVYVFLDPRTREG